MLFFSATVPKWVTGLVQKYLTDPKWIDVSSTDPTKNSTNLDITHLCISCPPFARDDTLVDLVKVHAGHYGKTVIFCDTKKEVNELSVHPALTEFGVGVLHGDIAQATRDLTLDSFKAGKIRALIATDVAARGLDIPHVNLVIQTKVPLDKESYVHRSGRTGRAGKKGVSLVFYSLREQPALRVLEHALKLQFKRIGPPQPADIIKGAATDAVKTIENVHQDSIDFFKDQAKKLLEDKAGAEEEIVAACLASLAG
jgi:superfamily II DNA/RNA helicase